MNRAVDALIVYRFIKLLVTPFNKQEAYKQGVIDENGNRIKDPVTGRGTELKTSQQRNSYTILHKMIFNIKKLLLKLPFISTGNAATWLGAMYLLKDTFKESKINDLSLIENAFNDILKEHGVELPDEPINESNEETKIIKAGKYKIKSDIPVRVGEDLVLANSNDIVFTESDVSPIDKVHGVDIYELTHEKTNQKIYVIHNDIYEDAPTNSVSAGGVSLPPDAVHQKKKKKDILRRVKDMM